MAGKPYRNTENRHQLSLFADHLDQHISQDNSVRAIDAYIGSLDLHKLGAEGYQASGSLRGQPAYNPADLLRLYLYGYLNGVRSSRKLERECQRNIEMMWLMQHQRPSYKTIANFRKNHAELLVRVNRDFILLCRSL
ncbi:transposase, partial [Oceanospirillum sp. HFRX-1_2]